ncbi:MAG: GntR family transcriptional regulator [bacterium]|nr:GntR family transcriptional regulator [bacterium]
MKANDVYQNLKQKIIQEELLPRQWLVERELSEQYGISRTPVREVLRKLVADGFLELKPAKGYVVKELSLKEIIETFQAREAVEGMLVKFACQRGDEQFFERVAELRRQLEELDIDRNEKAGVVIGSELHDLIAETAKNSVLFEFYQKLKNLAAITRNITKKSVNIEHHSKDEHLELMKAIEAKDSEKGEQCMRKHLHETCRRLVEEYVIIQGGL